MKSRFSALVLLLLSFTVRAQSLPQGAYQANREREFDIIHYHASIDLQFEQKKIFAVASIRLVPLKTLQGITLDAINLDITDVSLKGAAIPFDVLPGNVRILLPAMIGTADTIELSISYSAIPAAGMYFCPDPADPKYFYVSTYGEGGLHANWLPIYNDVNDKFSTEMTVKVPKPYIVISNGRLVEEQPTKDGMELFHWRQDLPHSNYLIALYVGRFEKGDLPPAFGSVPMSYWVPPGSLKEGAFAFRNTTKMVEFFSECFGFRYPWDKYDQIAIPNYAIGAMEHTGVTGHSLSVLRDASGPMDFSPNLAEYADDWHADATISHELAHHWFGDLLTCRNLSNIWLNESFASYAMMLWDEHVNGKDQLLFQTDLARRHYVEYVNTANVIRPLEYHFFDNTEVIYNEEHTYLKGAAILHMMRKVLGDEAFFRSLKHYVRKHQYGNVESNDLKIAIEEACGRNLDWFFEQWITGGGHPKFKISYRHLDDRKMVEVRVRQVQSIVDGQGIFQLPATITIATAAGTRNERVWVENADNYFVFPCDEAPKMVSFDGEGDLVAEIDFPKSLEELIYQAKNDAVPGRLRAIRRMAADYPANSRTVEAFKELLNDAFWGIQAETACQLGTLRTADAEKLVNQALKAKDYRVRKAAALALSSFRTPGSIRTLQQVVNSDGQNDVVAAAMVSLATADPTTDTRLLLRLMQRKSWSDELTIAGLRAFGILGQKSLIREISPYTQEKYNRFVRAEALKAWVACHPEDPVLRKTILLLLDSPVLTLQLQAIELTGKLCIKDAEPVLRRMVEQRADENLVVAANEALAAIERISAQP